MKKIKETIIKINASLGLLLTLGILFSISACEMCEKDAAPTGVLLLSVTNPAMGEYTGTATMSVSAEDKTKELSANLGEHELKMSLTGTGNVEIKVDNNIRETLLSSKSKVTYKLNQLFTGLENDLLSFNDEKKLIFIFDPEAATSFMSVKLELFSNNVLVVTKTIEWSEDVKVKEAKAKVDEIDKKLNTAKQKLAEKKQETLKNNVTLQEEVDKQTKKLENAKKNELDSVNNAVKKEKNEVEKVAEKEKKAQETLNQVSDSATREVQKEIAQLTKQVTTFQNRIDTATNSNDAIQLATAKGQIKKPTAKLAAAKKNQQQSIATKTKNQKNALDLATKELDAAKKALETAIVAAKKKYQEDTIAPHIRALETIQQKIDRALQKETATEQKDVDVLTKGLEDTKAQLETLLK